jgi:hypothetical protein
MSLPKINLPKNDLPKVNAWNNALKQLPKEKYHLDSPLKPKEGGYSILEKRRLETPDGQYAEMKVSPEDLEVEYITAKKGARTVLLPTLNPYLMKGSTKLIQTQNKPLEAENDKIAVSLASGWRGFVKEPSLPYKPLLKPNAQDVSEEELSTAISNIELEEKEKEKPKKTFEFKLNSRLR